MNKMLIEYAQIMSTAHWHWGSWDSWMTKPTHNNHPSVLWCAKSSGNYEYVYLMWSELLKMYRYRNVVDHATTKYSLSLSPKKLGIINAPMFTTSMLAMPDEFKQDDVEQAYKNYLNYKYSNWKSRTDKKKIFPIWIYGKPSWVMKDESRAKD
jgi:hypothetical protein